MYIGSNSPKVLVIRKSNSRTLQFMRVIVHGYHPCSLYGYYFSQCHIDIQETIATHLHCRRFSGFLYTTPLNTANTTSTQGCHTFSKVLTDKVAQVVHEEHSWHCTAFSQHTYLRYSIPFMLPACLLITPAQLYVFLLHSNIQSTYLSPCLLA